MLSLATDQLLSDPRSTLLVCADENESAFYRKQVLAYKEGEAHFEALTVLPAEQCWVSLWDASFPERQVLRPVQVLALARQIVDDSGLLPDTVLNSLAIARRFVDAFDLVAAHELESPPARWQASPELEAFADWQQQLQQRLNELGALSGAQLPAALGERLQMGLLELPERLVLSPRLELCASEQRLLRGLVDSGVEVGRLQAELGERGTLLRCAVDTVADEVERAARWVGELLRDGDSPPRLALVAVDIGPYEAPLRRALERHVFPYSLLPGELPAGSALSEPWRIGGGRLSSYPVIAVALDLLQVVAGECSLEQLCRVLGSSFVEDAVAERGARARLDWYWREELPGRSSLREALRCAERKDCLNAAAFLQRMEEVARYPRAPALPSQWVRRFDEELLNAGWPNREPGDAVVDQCRRGFSQVMDSLRALDRQLGPVDRTTALFWLQHILQGKRFELSRDQSAPLQILSLDDACSQQFDYLWLLGMSDSALPRSPDSNPFLPRDTLQTAGVPRFDATDCLRRDREQLNALLCAAPTVVLSCPQSDAEGVEQSRCSLLPWEAVSGELQESVPGLDGEGAVSLPATDAVRGLAAAERAGLRGGSGIFRDYALSPFLAFLKYRLRLQPFPRTEEGLDPATQGAWVHAALEHFWRQTKNSHALRELSEQELRERIESSVTAAMAGQSPHGDELLNIEKRRLISLLGQWLAFELLREEDFEVEATEQGGECTAFGIPLRLRIDRIDRIGDHRLIIDYKTGTVQGNKLNAENLLEPQLPLYALFADELLDGQNVDGVALAQVNARQGMSVHVRSSWTAQLLANKRVQNPVDDPEKWQNECHAWEKVLLEYAEGFSAGVIEHDYAQGSDAFRFDPYVNPLARDEEPGDD